VAGLSKPAMKFEVEVTARVARATSSG
jgi:hypothetical protein